MTFLPLSSATFLLKELQSEISIRVEKKFQVEMVIILYEQNFFIYFCDQQEHFKINTCLFLTYFQLADF